MRLSPLLLMRAGSLTSLSPSSSSSLPLSCRYNLHHQQHHQVRCVRPLHVTVIGAGIVGLSVAREVNHRLNGCGRQVEVTLVEHDDDVALHQTGRNSGVIHAGIYYRPKSLKALLCKQGHSLAMQYCHDHDIPVSKVGKLIVAMDDIQVNDLHMVYRRGLQNNVEGLQLLTNVDDVKRIEPTITESLKQAVYSPITAVVNWQAVAKSIANQLKKKKNTTFLFNHTPIKVSSVSVASMSPSSSSTMMASSQKNKLQLQLQEKKTQSTTTLLTDRIVTCAGVYADRVAHRLGGAWAPRIIPIRGEYMTLRSDIPESHKPKTNIYPVPPLTQHSSAAPPFLGVHFTPRPDDNTTLIGPNAVPALARDAYSWSVSDIRPMDILDMVSYKGVWALAWKHSRFAIEEVYKSLINRWPTIRDATRFVPCLEERDFVDPTPQTSGIRAQAVGIDGCLIDDFVFESVFDGRVLHVRNAPSPAATSSFAIAHMVVNRLQL